MTSNPQISSQSNSDWELIVNITNIEPSQLEAGKYDLGVSLQSDFIAVRIVASNQQSNWVNGGYINQVYQFDDFVVTSAQYFLAVNQINLIKLEPLAPIAFGLAYDPPKYFRDITIEVWKYTGIQTDLLLQDIATGLQNISVAATVDLSLVYEALDTLASRQLDIESKLEVILDKLDNIECGGDGSGSNQVLPSEPEQLFFLLQ